MRTYEQTHPWLTFRWEARRIPYPVWLLLGGTAARIDALGGVSLPPALAANLLLRARVEGLAALAAMEGNTLSSAQVQQCLAKTLQLPTSQNYLGQEILNLEKAMSWTEDRLKAGDRQLTPWSLQLLNAQVLKGLPWDEQVAPGDYRTVRQVTAEGGAPADDLGYLVERTCEWLAADRFVPNHAEERVAFGLIRAFLAQLYVLWLRPFADGNVRTAWLVTYQVLLEAGLPAIGIHKFFAHMGRARTAWFRESAQASKGVGDPIPFIAFMTRGLVEALGELQAEVAAAQQQALLGVHLHHLFGADATTNGTRRAQLMAALGLCGAAVSVAQVAQLTPELARSYARLDRKTLLRDLAHLQEQGLLRKDPQGIRAILEPLLAFPPLVQG
jgi:Fic family protein